MSLTQTTGIAFPAADTMISCIIWIIDSYNYNNWHRHRWIDANSSIICNSRIATGGLTIKLALQIMEVFTLQWILSTPQNRGIVEYKHGDDYMAFYTSATESNSHR